ncbi:Uu.00g017210.m01.CDS01 [Anthostomella pinea]|uniref:Uu.00g017210.m01.CDS01 n=1 Tax=Anthostomella pinea TaxID=933095 RepID=A0AAI8VYV9_9PEZI|nr:Uu.00g017210.m01.CDS01 [Anthostomella pinea]
MLFASPDESVLLIDIPRSIEEAQVPPGHTVERRIFSSSPVKTPWEMPEPKKGRQQQTPTLPAAAIAELMTLETVKAALETVKSNHSGPWCLPRIMRPALDTDADVQQPRKRKQTPADTENTNSTAPPFLPPNSHYLLGTIECQGDTFLKTAPKFDLMILDPPWPSRSVRRKQEGYATVYGMDEAKDLLCQIPVASHLTPDGLVAVWVTNKAAVTDLVTAPGGIFTQWGLEPIGEYIWLKITSSGDPVIDVESQWRKPWERLLIARRTGSPVKLPVTPKVMLAVPDVHSRKPNLGSLFTDVLPENYQGLEVFARNLTAGWWSWGNEALYFQQRHHWVDVDEDNTEQG